VEAVLDSKLAVETALDRIKAMFNAKPLVAHAVLYFTGAGLPDGEGGLALVNGKITLRDVITQWVFSDGGKAGAHLSIILDCCYSGLKHLTVYTCVRM
jgi:hypothetical protein